MTDKPKRKPIEVRNPRYAGATPEMVGRAPWFDGRIAASG